MWVAIVGGLLMIVVFGGGTMALLKFVSGKLRESEPYQFAMAAAQRDPAVTEALGSPLTAGTLVSGSFNESNLGSFYQLAVPISGPKGKGTLHVVANRSGGDERWSYQTLKVMVTGTKQTIPLNTAAPPLE